MTKFRTHQEIDNDFIRRGIFTQKDIDRLHEEEEMVGIALMSAEIDAGEFLKKRMGKIRYFIWSFFNSDVGLHNYQEQNFIMKAKELGWKDTFKYPKEYC